MLTDLIEGDFLNSAIIMNIQKYCVHDGPGIRTNVFFKGCPLKCWWCHNPESQNVKPEIMLFRERCIKCGTCAKKCPQHAIEIKNNIVTTDKTKCISCEKCAELCPNNAREYVGKNMTVQELMKEIVKDEIFYEQSNGGVTFSGGEPLTQIEFLNEVLERCKERGINTAIETSGFAAWEKISKIADKIDLFLYDIKQINNEKHLKYTGVENALILENLKKLSDKGCNLFIRMPIISGINDDDEHIQGTIKMLSDINILQVNLLPYHKMGMDKYKRLEREYKLSGMETPSAEKMEQISDKFKKYGFKVSIGG